MTAPSSEYLRLTGLPKSELARIMVRGETPDVEALGGWEFLGTNTPFSAKLLGIRKFLKAFYRDGSGRPRGYNMPVRQGSLDAPWVTKPDPEHPKRFGFFTVQPPLAESRDNRYLHALLLDYGEGGNGRAPVLNAIRDYLVRVHPGSDDLLLGSAYLAIGPWRVSVGHFVLERYRPTSWVRPAEPT
jgi:hypothetical protein